MNKNAEYHKQFILQSGSNIKLGYYIGNLQDGYLPQKTVMPYWKRYKCDIDYIPSYISSMACNKYNILCRESVHFFKNFLKIIHSMEV